MEAKLLRTSFPALQSPNASKFPSQISTLALQTRKPAILRSSLEKGRVLSLRVFASSTELAKKERVDESENLKLENIRQSLIRQEDSIIFCLLERSQYCYNADTYDPDAFAMEGFSGSLVEYLLKKTEMLHAQVGRYKSPDEHPFFPYDLPRPLLPPLQYVQVRGTRYCGQ
uniref:chorismate mutase n=1 Tax=Rhizophora mucronata TaxID=61149 RepID=A0A2P2K1U1_RHIMU